MTSTSKFRSGLFAALTIAAAISMTDTAGAADLKAAAPVYKAPVVDSYSPWMIRLRALGVIPSDRGTLQSTNTAALNPGLAQDNLAYSNSIVPELDITYFFTPNVAAELILGVTPHRITAVGPAILPPGGLPVGKTWLLPPTLMLQYHFTNFGAFKPYVGAGVNYTIMFNQSAANVTAGGLTVTNLKVHNGAGVALQAGFDYMIDRNWGINFDVKKLWLNPSYDATINNTILLSGKTRLNPWLIGGGVTYRFGGPVVAKF